MNLRQVLAIGICACSLFVFSIPGALAGMQDLPEGSYKYTCIGCIRNLDMLSCNCPNDAGQIKPTNLHLAGCNREISNRDGKLVCG